MIALTRLNHEAVLINPDLIERVERVPDTVLFLTTGRCLTVLESPQEIVDAIRAWRLSTTGWGQPQDGGSVKPFIRAMATGGLPEQRPPTRGRLTVT